MKTPRPIDVRDQLIQSELLGVDLSSLISVPNTSISDRAKIPNIAQDLRASFGVERILFSPIYPIPTETAPNGRQVWGSSNDLYGLIRFIGAWTDPQFSLGAQALGIQGRTGDVIEITFYGTGLNLLFSSAGSTSEVVGVTIDGVSAANSTFPVLGNQYTDLRNNTQAPSNSIWRIASGLALGIHTISISIISSPRSAFLIGAEIIGGASSLQINPGAYISGGERSVLAGGQSMPISTEFASSYGTVSTPSRGGRVIVYLDSDGIVKKNIQHTDTAALSFNSANHTNEEVTGIYYPREFSFTNNNTQPQDFSSVSGNMGFTLNDGVTSLIATNANFEGLSGAELPFGLPYDGLRISSSGSYIAFSFVGTGLDVTMAVDSATPRSFGPVTVSTLTINTILVSGGAQNDSHRKIKIASGLPYGSHTATFSLSGLSTPSSPLILNFIVYGPKRPPIPEKAVELADYCIPASFSSSLASSSPGFGTIRKFNTQEVVYSTEGWTISSTDPTSGGPGVGYAIQSPAVAGAGHAIRFAFFGTGFEWKFRNTATSSTWRILVDGVGNFTSPRAPSEFGAGWSGAVSSNSDAYGGGISTWTASTGTVVTSTTSVSGNAISFYGMTPGIHSVIIEKISTAGAGRIWHQSFDVITPTHTHAIQQRASSSTLSRLGSCSLQDRRKNKLLLTTGQKARSMTEVSNFTSGLLQSDTARWLLLPGTGTTIKTQKSTLSISFNCRCRSTPATISESIIRFKIYVDGLPLPGTFSTAMPINTTSWVQVSGTALAEVAEGIHRIDVYWQSSLGTQTITAANRSLCAVEL